VFEDFRGPDLKLQRAEHHIIDLHDLLKRFLEAQTYVSVADFELEPGKIFWVARGEELFPHDEFSPIIGDVVHNLRDSLDLAVSVIMRNANRTDANVQFPTSDSREAFCNAIKDGPKKKDFPDDLVAELKTRIQPYLGGTGYLLRILHNIAIADKHRLIVPSVFGLTAITVAAGPFVMKAQIVGQPRPIKNGSILASAMVEQFPHAQVGQEEKVSLTVAFDRSAGPLCGESIEDGCRKLYYATEEAIEALRSCLR
jgi:hypothetical protein